jgi:hypothetical protein
LRKPAESRSAKGIFMGKEKPESELAQLQKEQSKTKRDEVFGGLSDEERAEYDRKTKRINELVIETSAVTKKSSQSSKAEPLRRSDKESKTKQPSS